MNSQKQQQSFSSYSEDRNNELRPSQEDNFSEYQNQFQMSQSISPEQQAFFSRPEKRRYSYGKIDEKQVSFNYINNLNQTVNARPAIYTSKLKQQLKSGKQMKGPSSPSGCLNPTSPLIEYSKCYLSGLYKYYKEQNNKNVKKNKDLRSMSMDENQSVDQNRSMDRSEYWNGQRFSYLNAKEQGLRIQDRQSKLHYKAQKPSSSQVLRNLTTGLIVNRKQSRQNQISNINNKSQRYQKSYIKIQEDFSNSKNCSQLKRQPQQRPLSYQKKNRQALLQLPLNYDMAFSKRNKEINKEINKETSKETNKQTNKETDKESDEKFYKIKLKSKQNKHVQKESLNVRIQNNNLIKQKTNLSQFLIQRDAQIQRISKQRIMDNQQYMTNIQKLKILFQNQRNLMIKDFQEKLNIYKSVRKQAIKGELIKEQQEKVHLIIERSKIENQLKRVILQRKFESEQSKQKNQEIQKLRGQVSQMMKQLSANRQQTTLLRKKHQRNQKQLTDRLKASTKLSKKEICLKNEELSELRRIIEQEQMLSNERLQKQKASLKSELKLKNQQISELRRNFEEAQEFHATNNDRRDESATQILVKLPKWVQNFLNVFKNMALKLSPQIDPKSKDKKIVTIGWKIVKKALQRTKKDTIIAQDKYNSQLGQYHILQENEEFSIN